MLPNESTLLSPTICLEHQRPEDQPSSLGLICRECKQQLLASPPDGRCLAFWESQPAAYSLDQQPCFVYSLLWPEFRIRSLHSSDTHERSSVRSINECHRLAIQHG